MKVQAGTYITAPLGVEVEVFVYDQPQHYRLRYTETESADLAARVLRCSGDVRKVEHVNETTVDFWSYINLICGDVVRATLKPGHIGWDEGAINAGAHRASGVPEEHRDAYYRAYERAARATAERLVAEEGTRDGRV